jgi:hypothetical protein
MDWCDVLIDWILLDWARAGGMMIWAPLRHHTSDLALALAQECDCVQSAATGVLRSTLMPCVELPWGTAKSWGTQSRVAAP